MHKLFKKRDKPFIVEGGVLNTAELLLKESEAKYNQALYDEIMEQNIPLDEPKHHYPLMKKCYEISPYIQEREARNEQVRTVFLAASLFAILFFSAITGLLD